ncbi:HAD-IIA family hydrolase [Nocardioides sp. R-C-SC26]|uniref:HAD-IIA family hydrolase n=1 Tax=Nocardioides sp. R-C-SC26 TaxID=2870414 RepID=UPI001E62EB4F|nr:HAD-IIA family hydrolase [Nocardioides sp. R-C-SC26]
MLISSDRRLCDVYDVAMLDLDGVVYIGGDAVPGAPDLLKEARAASLRLAFVTNNAARTPETVAEHLRRLGVEADREDVVTSAQAAAGLLAAEYEDGAPIAVLGGDGLLAAVRERGLSPVEIADGDAVALVSGYGPDVRWSAIMQAAVRVRDGLPWVASNTDASIPTPFGTAPGHGVLVDTVARFAGAQPRVAGKPERPLLDETVARMNSARPLMVGDRLDTDIEGGRNAGIDTLLVLTGVSGIVDLVRAAPTERPTYLAADLGGLLRAHPAPQRVRDDVWTCGGWRAGVVEGHLVLDAVGDPAGRVDAFRALAAAAWSHDDETGRTPDLAGLRLDDLDDLGE